MKKTFTLLFFISILWISAISAEIINMVTATDLAPFAMETGERKGISVDLMNEIAKQMNSPVNIFYEPWKRAQQAAKNGANIVIMPLVRNSEREKQYLWIREIQSLEVSFITTNGKKYDLTSAKSLRTVLVQGGTPWVGFLEHEGFNNLEVVPETITNAKKLAIDRGDTWFVPVIEAKWIWNMEKISKPMTIGPSIIKTTNYLAMSINSDPQIVKKIGTAFDILKRKGKIDLIIKSYEK